MNLLRKRISIQIKGSVQGVGFRFEAQNRARTLGIAGFVRNNIDGSVYLEAEGETDKIDRFLYWCRSGPEYAEVQDIKITEQEPKNSNGFTIEK